MYEYATKIAPLYNHCRPTSFNAIKMTIEMFTDIKLDSNLIAAEFQNLPQIVWSHYASKIRQTGREMAIKLRNIGKAGALKTIGGKPIHKGGEYQRRAFPAAFYCSMWELIEKSIKLLPPETVPIMAYKYGFVIKAIDKNLVEAAMRQAVGMPVAIKITDIRMVQK